MTNVAVYAEFAIGFATQSACDLELAQFDLTYSELTKPAAFRAVQAFRLYRGAGGDDSESAGAYVYEEPSAHHPSAQDVLNLAKPRQASRRWRLFGHYP